MKKIFFYLICFALFNSVFAYQSSLSNYITKEWTTVEGLPGNCATDILQTNDGYIYIGTYEGLARFNGFDFMLFNKESDTECDFVSARALLQDSAGNLWVGSNDEGVAKISSTEKKLFKTSEGIPNNSIRSFTEDKEGNIWIGTASGICYVTPDESVFVPADTNNIGIKNVMVEQLFCDTAGRVWVLTQNINGLYYYQGSSFYRYTDLDEQINSYVTTISQDNLGTIWLGTGSDGIFRIRNGIVQKVPTNTVLDSVSCWTICQDSSGSIWFGTEKGIVLYHDGFFEEFAISSTFQNNSINKIIEDRENNIWVATDTAGIEKISIGKFRTESLGVAVNAIAEGSNNVVWVGADDGLYCFHNDSMVSNELTEYCKGLRIRHVATTENGDVLVNAYTKPAQIRYGKGGIKNWSTDNGLAGDKTRVSVEISNGDVYVGTTTGLSIIKPDGSIRNILRADGLDNEYVMCIYQDTEDMVWIGTDGGGIFIMQDEKIVDRLTTKSGLAGNVVFKIMQDSAGVYWICTGNGITRYEKQTDSLVSESDEKSFCNYTQTEGLGTSSVFQMVIDNSNTVWMTSNTGISSVSLADLNELAEGKRRTVDAKFYNQNDGIRTAGVNSTALSMLDRVGRVWFTLVDGFTVYDPVRNQSSGIRPLVHIESVVLDGKEIEDFENGFSIPAGSRRLDISYVGLCFTAPERLRFKHMLTGFDKDYAQPTQSRIVSYTNLRPGDYRFLLSTMNIDGIWGGNPVFVEFSWEPFYYQRPVFWVIIGALAIALVILIIIVRERVNKARQLQLETMVQIQTIDLEIERDRSERLLRSILPESIAERLKVPGQRTIADRFDMVTVLFMDIVNFTKTSEQENPEDIVTALNDLISRFDERAKKMGVEKIKTIGDAYMAACGVPMENPDHAMIIVKFATGMYEDLEEYNKTAKIKFSIRIGINSGPVIAGVIGKDKFVYDIWGDTVNIASRMEKLCTPGRIRMTEATRKIVEKQLITSFSSEEDCEVKGKGKMHTYEL